MSIAGFCRREAVTIAEEAPLTQAAQLMRERHIGYLVVVKTEAAGSKVVGVLTDRDIVVTAVALGDDPKSMKVRDVMTVDPLLAKVDSSMEGAMRLMRDCGVRRMPVVDLEGAPVGVITMDDLIHAVADQIGCLSVMIDNEQRNERLTRIPSIPPIATTQALAGVRS
jgi:CBS domain-containing protein